MSTPPPPSVFVSYSHESESHSQRVLALANQLRAHGIDARIDQYVPSPPAGWPHWMQEQAVECSFVLVVCTATYRERFDRQGPAGTGKGVQWEGMIVQQLLYDAGTRNEKLVPVLFEDGEDTDVPLSLRAYTRYRLPGQYEALFRHLTRQPLSPAPPIGPIKPMPPAPPPTFGARTSASPPLDDHALVDELAKVLYDADEARLVAQRAGFSPAVIPAFRTALVFWSNLVEAARNGAIAGGVQAVSQAAARQYPANPTFRRHSSP